VEPTIVDAKPRYRPATLVEPPGLGYLLLSADDGITAVEATEPYLWDHLTGCRRPPAAARGTLNDVAILERTVNGQPGLVAQQDGVTVTGVRVRPRRRPNQAHLGSTQPREAPALDDGLTRVSGRQLDHGPTPPMLSGVMRST
jgi:hypothetical protein